MTTAAVFIVAPAFNASADTVERRGQERDANLALNDVTVTAIGDDGVKIKRADGTAQVIPLDRVRDIHFDAAPTGAANLRAGEWARLQPMATRLWRARSRIERGDTGLAEPVLEELFFGGRADGASQPARPYHDLDGETALVVAEGLLRCRLARGDQAGAILPALVVTRLRHRGVTTISYSSLAPVWDATTSLCPQLPPVLPEGPGTTAALTKLVPAVKGDDPLVSELAALYAASMLIRSDGTLTPAVALPTPPATAREMPATAIMRAILQTQQGDAAARASARGALDKLAAAASKPSTGTKGAAAASTDAWLPAWSSFAMGTSLLRVGPEAPRESDPAMASADADLRRRGIVALLAVPARSDRVTPWLAGAALVLAASALERSGDHAAAATIRRELDIEHPYHPLRAAMASGATAAPASAGSPRSPSKPAPRKETP